MAKITVRCALTAEQYEAFQLLPGKTEEQKVMQAIATQWLAVERQAAEQRASMENVSPLAGVRDELEQLVAGSSAVELAAVNRLVEGSNPSPPAFEVGPMRPVPDELIGFSKETP